MVNPKGISPLSFTSLTTSFAHNTRPIPAEAHQPVAEHLVKTALPPKQQSSSINNNHNNNNHRVPNHSNSKPKPKPKPKPNTTITIITITTIIITITMERPLRPQLGLRIIIVKPVPLPHQATSEQPQQPRQARPQPQRQPAPRRQAIGTDSLLLRINSKSPVKRWNNCEGSWKSAKLNAKLAATLVPLPIRPHGASSPRRPPNNWQQPLPPRPRLLT